MNLSHLLAIFFTSPLRRACSAAQPGRSLAAGALSQSLEKLVRRNLHVLGDESVTRVLAWLVAADLVCQAYPAAHLPETSLSVALL
jgi:hypothetical protein